MHGTSLRIIVVFVICMLGFVSQAYASWPAVVSNVVIILRNGTTGYTPAKFDYKLTHLGVVQYQGALPLTPSHHSLIAAGAQYQAYENAACATATQILPNPSGAAIQVVRANYYLIPPSTRILINKTTYDCP